MPGVLRSRARWMLAAILLAACSEGTATAGLEKPTPVVTVSIGSSTRALTIGQTVQLTAIGRDDHGNVVPDRVPQWSSDDPLVASVSDAGLVTAHRIGSATIAAAIDGRHSSVVVVVAEVSVASVVVTPGVAALVVGGTRQLTAVARDAAGNPLPDRIVRWSTSNPAVLWVSDSGLITARTAGFATITAESDTKSRSVPVTVCATTGLYVTGAYPAAFTPGGSGTIAGCNFAATIAGNTVTLDGIRLTVTGATPTQLDVMIPAATQYACTPERQVTLSVSAGSGVASRAHRIATANQHALAIGESVTLLDASSVRCNELTGSGSRYFISVFNTTGSVTDLTSVELRGSSGAPIVASAANPVDVQVVPQIRAAAAGTGMLDPDRLRHRLSVEAHERTLDASREITRMLGDPDRYRARRAPPRGSASDALAPSLAMAAAGPAIGETVTMRVWKHDSGSCGQYDEISARTVYVGPHVILREDVAAPLARRMDDYYRALGDEFETTMYPVLVENFGNPLVLDAQLDANGRIIVVFSERVNNDDLAGFVISCDFYPRSVAPSSNEGEIFYAYVPTDSSAGYPSGLLTRDKWRREMRSTLIHEAKHITSFAERLSRDAPFEESWLEEGTAMHAEELWSRTGYGSAWKGNTLYETSLYCDVRQTTAGCTNSPYVMLQHFTMLYDYLASVETLTPLGRATAGDYSFYGSAWAFVRWMIDHHATGDAAFLKPLTQASVTGLENLSLRSGRPFAEMLADWSLAMAADDYPGVTPARRELSFPSWQTRDIFAAMNRDYTAFTRPVPLATRPVRFGAFSGALSLRGGTAAIFEMSGTQLATQLLELRTATGAAPPANTRIAILRVQ